MRSPADAAPGVGACCECVLVRWGYAPKPPARLSWWGPWCPTPSPAGRAVRALVGLGPVVGEGQGAHGADQRQLFWPVDDDEVGRLVGGEMCV